ncbi:putative membrane protein insertion efficiency factor [Glycomyces sambucus]|uniref:Putative membrane protein insertion efficiency factor n=1 Tax=Glycomyces sambucus TaxID=380244 RepID=A0A1G9HAI4_9ACTN|nr:membrane protein insertion efficiency factor YidD [Glycomyces sambucus]SDL09473.1 putative membrane protein insertion efficiency factor [Glycomyces sambucus]
MEISGCVSVYQAGCATGCGEPLAASCDPGGPCNACAAACGGATDPGPFHSLLLGAFGFGRLTPERLERARTGHRPGPRRFGLRAIAWYRRFLSPRVQVQCRFVPSCSGYGYRAVSRYGLSAGGRLAAARVLRCRPGVTRGTRDPVPGR